MNSRFITSNNRCFTYFKFVNRGPRLCVVFLHNQYDSNFEESPY